MYILGEMNALNGPNRAFELMMVPGAGIEPARCITPRDFKSLASTCSATRAMGTDVQVLLAVFP